MLVMVVFENGDVMMMVVIVSGGINKYHNDDHNDDHSP